MSLLGNLVTTNGVQLLSFNFTAGTANSALTVPGIQSGDVILALINLSNNNYEGNQSDFRRLAHGTDTLWQGGAANGDNYLAIVLRP